MVLPPDWPAFLEDFCAHWPTDGKHTYVDFVRDRLGGKKVAARWGEQALAPTWTEKATGSAKSVFHFDVQGSVAKSTHAGIPLAAGNIRARAAAVALTGPSTDGASVSGASVITEAYPRLWERRLSPGRPNLPIKHRRLCNRPYGSRRQAPPEELEKASARPSPKR